MYTKVLIATDGSETAARAVRAGADMARASSAEIILLTVGDVSVAERAAQDISEGLTVTPIGVEGDPADQILEVAEREGVDLIVVGNKGMTGAKRFLLGSVPNAISHHAPCHVLIVKTT